MCGNGVFTGMEIIRRVLWQTPVDLSQDPERYAGAGAGSDMDICAALPIGMLATPPADIVQPVSDLSGLSRAIWLARKKKNIGYKWKKNVKMVLNSICMCLPHGRKSCSIYFRSLRSLLLQWEILIIDQESVFRSLRLSAKLSKYCVVQLQPEFTYCQTIKCGYTNK